MIASLEESRLRSEREADEAHVLLEEAQTIRAELQERLHTYDDKKENLEKKAKDKARKIVDEAKKEAETIIAELREMKEHAASNVKEHELIDAKKRLEEAAPKENKVFQHHPTKTKQVFCTEKVTTTNKKRMKIRYVFQQNLY